MQDVQQYLRGNSTRRVSPSAAKPHSGHLAQTRSNKNLTYVVLGQLYCWVAGMGVWRVERGFSIQSNLAITERRNLIGYSVMKRIP